MKEEYKTCPYCHNMVDKKDKQCPYCLKSLGWLSGSVNYTPNTQRYNPRIEGYGSNNDTIKDDKQQKKNGELSPFFQKILDIQQGKGTKDEEITMNRIKTIMILFVVIIRIMPIIIRFIKMFLID